MDHLSDGRRVGEHREWASVHGAGDGSGCSLGTIIAAFLGVVNVSTEEEGENRNDDKYMAVMAAILLYEIAAEMAAQSPGCDGTGDLLASLDGSAVSAVVVVHGGGPRQSGCGRQSVLGFS